MMTVEEHNVNGGLGSLVAEVLAEAGTGITLKRAGIMDGEYAAAADRGGCVSIMDLMLPELQLRHGKCFELPAR